MIAKTDEVMIQTRKSHRFFKNFGPSNDKYINDNLLIDMMLKEQTLLYTGGAGSCAGCGEGTALRMLCSATGSKYGDQWGIVAAHRVQHGLHLDLSLQSLPCPLDQLAL